MYSSPLGGERFGGLKGSWRRRSGTKGDKWRQVVKNIFVSNMNWNQSYCICIYIS